MNPIPDSYPDLHDCPAVKPTLPWRKTLICITLATILSSCHPIDIGIVPATATPTIEIQVSTELPMTPTATPVCMAVSGVEIKATLTTANSVTVTVTGLMPDEPVSIVLYSEFQGATRSMGAYASEKADESGHYEFTTGLRSSNSDTDFKDWRVQVVHSQGVACTSFSLP